MYISTTCTSPHSFVYTYRTELKLKRALCEVGIQLSIIFILGEHYLSRIDGIGADRAATGRQMG
jgi:hypothetical protein